MISRQELFALLALLIIIIAGGLVIGFGVDYFEQQNHKRFLECLQLTNDEALCVSKYK